MSDRERNSHLLDGHLHLMLLLMRPWTQEPGLRLPTGERGDRSSQSGHRLLRRRRRRSRRRCSASSASSPNSTSTSGSHDKRRDMRRSGPQQRRPVPGERSERRRRQPRKLGQHRPGGLCGAHDVERRGADPVDVQPPSSPPLRRGRGVVVVGRGGRSERSEGSRGFDDPPCDARCMQGAAGAEQSVDAGRDGRGGSAAEARSRERREADEGFFPCHHLCLRRRRR